MKVGQESYSSALASTLHQSGHMKRLFSLLRIGLEGLVTQDSGYLYPRRKIAVDKLVTLRSWMTIGYLILVNYE